MAGRADARNPIGAKGKPRRQSVSEFRDRIVFVQPRHNYESYADLREMVKIYGYKTCYIGEIELESDNIYIMAPINGEYHEHMGVHGHKPKHCKIILWHLERPEDPAGDIHGKLAEFVRHNLAEAEKLQIDHIWFSDRYVARLFNNPVAKFVPLGSSPDLIERPRAWQVNRKEYQIIHLSYANHRRNSLLGPLIHDGVKIAPNGWGKARADALRQSRFLLNTHQNDYLIWEPLRFAVAASVGIPCISEAIYDPFPMIARVHYHSVDTSDFKAMVKVACKVDYLKSIGMAQQLHHLLCDEYRFDKNVEKAVAELIGTP